MPVQFNVATLLMEPLGSTREYAIEGRVLIDDQPRHCEVRGRAALLRTGDGVLVTADLRGEEHAACSRCLTDVAIPLALTFEEVYLGSIDPSPKPAAGELDQREVFRIDEKHILDMEEAIRQAWTVALPMQPLCGADCRGLCSRCGHDLNEGACSCPPDVDERWSALQQLASQMEGT